MKQVRLLVILIGHIAVCPNVITPVLANRRERRREKKAIVNSRKPDSDAETNVDEPEDSRKMKSNKKDKKGLAAGLALMHGFSASNVGPGRLTVSFSVSGLRKDTKIYP